MTGRLQGKIALITGGCSGIGRATAELFLAEGAHVVVADLQDDLGADLEALYPQRLRYSRCDVTAEADIAAAMAVAAEFGGLDILFNNAGAAGRRAGAADTLAEDWDASQALLLRAPMLGMKHAVPLMRARGGGAIVNTASIGGIEAGWGSLAYAVAKAGVIHMSKLVALELAADGIRVNAVTPGFILTPILANTVGRPAEDAEAVVAEFAEAAAQTQPIRRPGKPSDIAAAVLYLVSDEAGFVTAHNLVVDGGVTGGQRSAWDRTASTPLREKMKQAESVMSPSGGGAPPR